MRWVAAQQCDFQWVLGRGGGRSGSRQVPATAPWSAHLSRKGTKHKSSDALLQKNIVHAASCGSWDIAVPGYFRPRARGSDCIQTSSRGPDRHIRQSNRRAYNLLPSVKQDTAVMMGAGSVRQRSMRIMSMTWQLVDVPGIQAYQR